VNPEVAHFVNRLVFCLFADDVDLLPPGLFERMLDAARKRPGQFEFYARRLFAAMAERGGEVDFTPVAWFNGGLFDTEPRCKRAQETGGRNDTSDSILKS